MSTDNIIPFPSDAVTEKDGEPITTSLRVAEIFGKQHKNVLRALERLECSAAFIERNFALVDYTDAKGERRPMYEMTRNGFVFLAMGFTGSKAARFKEAYIERFDVMEKHLQEQWLAGELEPLFDDAGLPRDRLETAKAQRRQMSQMKALLFRADPRLKQIVRYKVAGLNHAEIGKLLDMHRSTVTRLVKEMAAAGLFRFGGQIVPGQSKGKTYPKVGVAPQVVNLPVKPRKNTLPPAQPDANDPSGDLFA